MFIDLLKHKYACCDYKEKIIMLQALSKKLSNNTISVIGVNGRIQYNVNGSKYENFRTFESFIYNIKKV